MCITTTVKLQNCPNITRLQLVLSPIVTITSFPMSALTRNLFSNYIVLSFQDIIWNHAISDQWRLDFFFTSIMPLSFTQVVRYSNSLFLFITEYCYCRVWVYNIITAALIKGQFGCFCFQLLELLRTITTGFM